MKTAQSETVVAGPGARSNELERLFDSEVYDSHDKRIGGVNAVWTDANGHPAFIGVRIPESVGQTHVIPARGMEAIPGQTRVRVAFTREEVENAPVCSPHLDLTDEQENNVLAYYQTREVRP